MEGSAMRIPILAFGLLVLGRSFAASPVSADCINYADYIHWVGGEGTSGGSLGLAIQGNYAYVCSDGYALKVIDITDPLNPVTRGGVSLPAYSWSVAVVGSHAYVADRNSGLYVIDVSDPDHPR